MALINASNLKYYLSGGAGNTDQNASLGGARSTTLVPAGSGNLFDDVTSAEATSGDAEFRCIYFRNEDTNVNGLVDPVLWISVNTPSATTTIELGLDPAGKNGTATTIVDESTAPDGVSFSATYSSKPSGLHLPDEPYNQNDYIAVWIKRVIDAGTASYTSDGASIRVEGESA